MELIPREIKIKDLPEDISIKEDTTPSISLEIDGKIVNVPLSVVGREIRIGLSSVYRQKLYRIERELQLSTKETIMALMDFYYMDNPKVVQVLNKNLRTRIAKGVNQSFLLQLKLLHAFTGHFLKKIRYIK